MKNSAPKGKEYSINLIVLQEPDPSRLLKNIQGNRGNRNSDKIDVTRRRNCLSFFRYDKRMVHVLGNNRTSLYRLRTRTTTVTEGIMSRTGLGRWVGGGQRRLTLTTAEAGYGSISWFTTLISTDVCLKFP